MSSDGGKVMCQIAVNRARERGYQSVADFEHPKVDFDFHPKVQNEDLPVGGQLFHVGAGSSDEHTLILDKEVLFQFFRDIPGVCPKQSSQLLVHLAENLSVAAIARRQFESKHPAFDISRKMKLEAIEETLGAFRHCRQDFHSSVRH